MYVYVCVWVRVRMQLLYEFCESLAKYLSHFIVGKYQPLELVFLLLNFLFFLLLVPLYTCIYISKYKVVNWILV